MPDSKTMQKNRSRVITWNDPKLSSRKPLEINGFDYLCAIRDNKIEPPPVAKLLGYQLIEVAKGRTVFELPTAEFLYNPFATVHGGIVMTLLDTAMTAAVLTELSKGTTCSTLEMKTNFLRPIDAKTGLLRAEAKIIYLGRRTATAEGQVRNSQGKRLTVALSTCLIIQT